MRQCWLNAAVKSSTPRKAFGWPPTPCGGSGVDPGIIPQLVAGKNGHDSGTKKLFFNLRKLKNKMQMLEDGDLTPEHVETIATKLDVSEQDVINMNRRMAGGDHSLNAPMKIDGEASGKIG